MSKIKPTISEVLNKYNNIYVIMSPPRCSSTAFARVFWEQPTVGAYCHEPFEVTYYRTEGLEAVAGMLQTPLDLNALQKNTDSNWGTDLVIKEMPYQAGANFPLLASWAKPPIVFLVRDPRLNIASRIQKKIEGGDSPEFPLKETGWELIQQQVDYCQAQDIPHIIVDATDFRNHPKRIFEQVFEKFDLPFSEDILSWEAYPEIDLDNLGGDHTHLYRRVMGSTGILPATETVMAVEDFPDQEGLREHILECLEIYNNLRSRPNRIRIE